MTAVGVSVPRVDGPAKVSGSGQYTADIELPGMVHAKVLRSPYPHARVTRIDASQAERLPGVVAVLTRDDLHDIHPYYGSLFRDQPIVAIVYGSSVLSLYEPAIAAPLDMMLSACMKPGAGLSAAFRFTS